MADMLNILNLAKTNIQKDNSRDQDYKISAINNVISRLDKSPNTIEAIYVGTLLQKSDVLLAIEKTAEKAIINREINNFNKNIADVLDITSLPNNTLTSHMDKHQLISIIRENYPEKFFPGIWPKLVLINGIDNIFRFNSDFNAIFETILSGIRNSYVFKQLFEVDITTLINELNKKNVPGSKRTNIYSKQYNNMKLISIDITQANFTSSIYYFANKLKSDGHGLDILGLNLEKIYGSWEEFDNKICWKDMVYALMLDNKDLDPTIVKLIAESKQIRQVCMGQCLNTKSSVSDHLLVKLTEIICRTLMACVKDFLIDYIKTNGGEIISVMNDEIILQTTDFDSLKKSYREHFNKDNLMLNKMKFSEFVLKSFVLESGRSFYVKYFTDGAIPLLKSVHPDDRVKALELMG
jgi:hypothetical protein